MLLYTVKQKDLPIYSLAVWELRHINTSRLILKALRAFLLDVPAVRQYFYQIDILCSDLEAKMRTSWKGEVVLNQAISHM